MRLTRVKKETGARFYEFCFKIHNKLEFAIENISEFFSIVLKRAADFARRQIEANALQLLAGRLRNHPVDFDLFIL